jgi:type IV pilus assembly protein PilC
MIGTAASPLKARVETRPHVKIRRVDLLAFFQQLSTMFCAGTPLHDALCIASEQSQSVALGATIEKVAARVGAGQTLHDSLSRYPDHFKPEWVAAVRSGEQSGQLGTVLKNLVTQISANQQFRAKLVSAMVYPIVVVCVAVVAVTIMLVKVVPTFAELFSQVGRGLPDITIVVLGTSDTLRSYGLHILGGVIALFLVLRLHARSETGRASLHALLVRVPVIGDIIVETCMQRFASNTALLLRSRLPLLETIRCVRGILRFNLVYEQAMGIVAYDVERGSPMSDGMERAGVFKSFVISMTRVGEKSGELPSVLEEVDFFYRKRVETVVLRLTRVVESAIVIAMGVVIAVILFAIYLPMFSMASGVG